MKFQIVSAAAPYIILALWIIFRQSHNFLPCWREQIITYHCKHSKAERNWEAQHYPCSIKVSVNDIGTWNSDCPKHKDVDNCSITHLSCSVYNRYYTVKDSIKPLWKQHDNNMSASIHQYHFIWREETDYRFMYHYKKQSKT